METLVHGKGCWFLLQLADVHASEDMLIVFIILK